MGRLLPWRWPPYGSTCRSHGGSALRALDVHDLLLLEPTLHWRPSRWLWLLLLGLLRHSLCLWDLQLHLLLRRLLSLLAHG